MGRGTRGRNAARLWLAAFLAFASLLLAPAAAEAQPALAPRIVLQQAFFAGTEVAAWTPDDRYIVTATGYGLRVTIWDVASGVVLDQVQLPGGPKAESVFFTDIAISADGAIATIRGLACDEGFLNTIESRDYAVDLRARTAVRLPKREVGDMPDAAIRAYLARVDDFAVIYDGGATPAEIARAEAKLPKLPASHDGRTTLRRNASGLLLTTPGTAPRRLRANVWDSIYAAALSPEGRQLAIALAGPASEATTFSRVALSPTASAAQHPLKDWYGQVAWLDQDTLLLAPATSPLERMKDWTGGEGALPPSLLIDAASGATRASIPSRCFVQPLRPDVLIAADLGSCRKGVGGRLGLVTYGPAKQWTPLPLPAAKGASEMRVLALVVAPAGPSVTVILEDPEDGLRYLLIFDKATAKVTLYRELPTVAGRTVALGYSPDGEALVFATESTLYLWRPKVHEPAQALTAQSMAPSMLAVANDMALVSGASDDVIKRSALKWGSGLPPLAFPRAIAGGFVPGKPIFWAASALGGVRLWDTRDWSVMYTSYYFENGFLSVAPDGRYDTNLGPDTPNFRWLVSDAPFQSLAPQTFMRDYFEPRMTQKLWDCHEQNNCGQALKPLRAMADLNRVLPTVRITKIAQGADPTEALVDVEVREGVDASAANGKTRSGAYNLRLFRNNRLEAQWPAPPADDVTLSLPDWRSRNRLEAGPDGVIRTQFKVRLPTAADADKADFTAYAFNEDRVKSETARRSFTRAKVTPVPPKAYVLTLGIDGYDTPRLRLNFAAGDARLLGDRLAAIPGYETHRLTIAGPREGGARVTREVIEAAIGLLGGRDRPALLARLAKAGVDGSALQPATPDDVVIISFAGHGWASPRGEFYLVPAEGRWPDRAEEPDTATLISAADLTNWLRPVASAEMAVIIDACHSAAGVEGGGYKPGPMGDPGLGQLAYDKGIRILAATQADDVALEDPALRQGLLTYALAGEGIQAKGGQADLDRDGKITLDEWLRYATQRLPALSQDVRLGRFAAGAGAGARSFGKIETPAERPRPQEPSLFDFTGHPSPVILRNTG